MLIGTDFLWKAMQVGKLRDLLRDLPEDDWVYADREGDLKVIRAERFPKEKERAYPGDRVVDFIREKVRASERASS